MSAPPPSPVTGAMPNQSVFHAAFDNANANANANATPPSQTHLQPPPLSSPTSHANPDVRTCLQALQALYHHPDNAMKHQADQALIHLAKQPLAWTVCDQILHTPNLDEHAYFFAANTLRTKLVFAFSELNDASHRRGFRDSLIQHIMRFSKGPNKIRSRLAMAVGVCAVQMAGLNEWSTCLADLRSTFGTPDYALSLLDMLTMIPEECGNKRLIISQDALAYAQKIFASSGNDILAMLLNYLQTTGSNRQLQQKVFDCFLAWVRQQFVPLTDLPNNPLFQYTIKALDVPELQEVALEVMTELVHQSEDMQSCWPLVHTLINVALKLGPLYRKSVEENDDQLAKKICQMYVEIGESYMPFILQGSEESKQIIFAILQCTGHSSSDISSATFNFWYVLSFQINNPASNAHTKIPPERIQEMIQTKKQQFGPFFSQLVDQILMIMRYDEEYERLSAEAKENAKKFRYYTAEALSDAEAVVGNAHCLTKIVEMLIKEVPIYQANPKKWQGVEACLYCIRSIARKVDLKENVIIPKVMELLPQFHGRSELRYTATLIVGRYADWLNLHPEYIHKLLDFVCSGLHDPEIVAAAALAFKHVCDGCRTHLATQYMQNCFHVYSKSSGFTLQDQKEIIEGLSCVISALDKNQLLPALQQLVHPIATEFAVLMKQVSDGLSQHHNEINTRLPHVLDRLAEVFRSLDPNCNMDGDVVQQSAIQVLTKIWPLLEQAIVLFKSDDRKMEKICRVWKHCIKLTSTSFSTLLQPLINTLLTAFQQYPHSCFIYTASITIDVFSKEQTYHPLLLQIYEGFTVQVTPILSSPTKVTDHPDIFEDYMEMLSRFLRLTPELILTSRSTPCHPLLPQAFTCALHGIHIHHLEASRSVMTFLELFFQQGYQLEFKDGRKGKPVNPMCLQALTTILQQHGETCVRLLLRGIASELPIQRCSLTIPVFQSLVKLCGAAAVPWFQEGIKDLPNTPKPTKEEVLRGLFEGGPVPVPELLTHYWNALRQTQPQ